MKITKLLLGLGLFFSANLIAKDVIQCFALRENKGDYSSGSGSADKGSPISESGIQLPDNLLPLSKQSEAYDRCQKELGALNKHWANYFGMYAVNSLTGGGKLIGTYPHYRLESSQQSLAPFRSRKIKILTK